MTAGSKAAGRVLLRLAPPVLVGAAFLLLWQWFVIARHIQPYVLPRPTAIWTQLTDDASDIAASARTSGTNALVGLLTGSALALAAALAAARSPLVSELLDPVAAAVNAMPVIALAPLFNTMFSSTSSVPRRLVVTVVVFFPVFVNAVRGFRQVDPVHRELFVSYDSSPWQMTLLLRLPGSLPFVFTGLRLASSLAVIAAIVSEYFGGLQTGLGSRITSAAANTAYATAWAYVVAACLLGLTFYLVALLLERLAMPWRTRTVV